MSAVDDAGLAFGRDMLTRSRDALRLAVDPAVEYGHLLIALATATFCSFQAFGNIALLAKQLVPVDPAVAEAAALLWPETQQIYRDTRTLVRANGADVGTVEEVFSLGRLIFEQSQAGEPASKAAS